MARITCGRCKNTHSSANEVRNCYSYDDAPRRPSTTEWAKANQTSAAAPTVLATMPEARKILAAPNTRVPEGRYALTNADDDGTVRFYEVQHGKEGGKWEGYTFVTHHVGPAEYAVRNRETRNAILAKIRKNPQEAMARYGHLIGKCGKCGLRLTNEESRARGIGPICAGNMGW